MIQIFKEKKYKALSKLTTDAAFPNLPIEERVKKLSEAYTTLVNLK